MEPWTQKILEDRVCRWPAPTPGDMAAQAAQEDQECVAPSSSVHSRRKERKRGEKPKWSTDQVSRHKAEGRSPPRPSLQMHSRTISARSGSGTSAARPCCSRVRSSSSRSIEQPRENAIDDSVPSSVVLAVPLPTMHLGRPIRASQRLVANNLPR